MFDVMTKQMYASMYGMTMKYGVQLASLEFTTNTICDI